ncbi:hypothetical protein NPIL_690631 [Nephila pilipes]|uniref:Uncharacterized protein n=1 Tax=Nephila pilipes TaxID=299642 RepID=A0A8X6NPS4_NEPPI|nr:hypothetical protein NPIL_690631 [Nephila pilipes]
MSAPTARCCSAQGLPRIVFMTPILRIRLETDLNPLSIWEKLPDDSPPVMPYIVRRILSSMRKRIPGRNVMVNIIWGRKDKIGITKYSFSYMRL